MKHPCLSRLLKLAALVVLASGCGFPDTSFSFVDFGATEPPPVVPGALIGFGSIELSQTGELPAVVRIERMVPEDVPASAGKVLVFALWDESQPWLRCQGVATSSTCAILLVQEGALPGLIRLETDVRQATYFLVPSFELGAAPAPGCVAYLIGGDGLQWHAPLNEQLPAFSPIQVELSLRRTQAPGVILGWQLILADPPIERPEGQTAIGCS